MGLALIGEVHSELRPQTLTLLVIQVENAVIGAQGMQCHFKHIIEYCSGVGDTRNGLDSVKNSIERAAQTAFNAELLGDVTKSPDNPDFLLFTIQQWSDVDFDDTL